MGKKDTQRHTEADEMVLPPPGLDERSLRGAIGFIEARWGELERVCHEDLGTLIGLPNPYFTASKNDKDGFTLNQLHYWDTYFIARGLIGTKREAQAYEQAENLLHLLKRFQVIPAGNRTYLTSRSQPPILTSLLLELHEHKGSEEWLAPRIELAKQEYRDVWMSRSHPHWRQVFAGLSRNYDANQLSELAEDESGWGYTTRFNGSALDFIPIDLNALLYKYETDFMKAALILGKPKEAQEWKATAETRRRTIDEYLWNQSAGFYFDYNYQTGKSSNIWSLASYYALWCGLASEEQAARLVEHIEKFEMYGGLCATLERPAVSERLPAQWSYPNGWAPLHLIAIEGLARYGYEDVAARISRRWLHTCLEVFNRQGDFYQKYNVVDIDAPPKDGLNSNQTGFAWTNAVFTILARDYKDAVL